MARSVTYPPFTGQVQSGDLANGAVTTAKLANDAVTAAKIGSDIDDDVTITESAGVLSVKAGGVLLSAPVVDSGSSSSGTPGTEIATIAAAAGKRLAAIQALIDQPGSGSDVVLTATMADDTTRTLTIALGGGGHVIANMAGGLRGDTVSGTVIAWSAAIDQAVKSVVATTSGAGVGARAVALQAVEVMA